MNVKANLGRNILIFICIVFIIIIWWLVIGNKLN